MVVDPLAELYANCDVGWSKAKRHPATSFTSSPLDGDETEGLPGFVATWKKEGTSAVEGPSTLLDRATEFRAYRISRKCHTYLPSALQICRYWLGWTVTSVITVKVL
jgi:hypothetical protein